MDAFEKMCYALPFQALSTSSIADIDEARADFERGVDERVDAKLAKTRVVRCSCWVGPPFRPRDHCTLCLGHGYKLEVPE